MATRKSNPATAVAKQQSKAERDPVQLSTGYWVRIRPVSASLIDGAQAMIEDPPVPMVYIEAKGRDEPNPSDPAYLRALERTDTRRVIAATDAMILFGIELVDGPDGNPVGVPEDGEWLQKLRLLEKHGALKLDEFDLKDDIDREFLFKKYIVVGAPDIVLLSLASGVREEDVQNAARTFRGN